MVRSTGGPGKPSPRRRLFGGIFRRQKSVSRGASPIRDTYSSRPLITASRRSSQDTIRVERIRLPEIATDICWVRVKYYSLYRFVNWAGPALFLFVPIIYMIAKPIVVASTNLINLNWMEILGISVWVLGAIVKGIINHRSSPSFYDYYAYKLGGKYSGEEVEALSRINHYYGKNRRKLSQLVNLYNKPNKSPRQERRQSFLEEDLISACDFNLV